MERLTNSIDYCKMICDENKCIFEDKSKCYEKSLYDSLREYEKLEEQGLLLRLPCKVGDVAYCFGYPRTDIVALVEEKVEGIYVTEIGVRFETDDGYYSPDDVGQIVFFNREQAEAALEKLRGRRT